MGRKSKLLKANIYEDYEPFEEEEVLIFSNSPQTKRERRLEKANKKKETKAASNGSISTKLVDCTCNFCKSPLQGTLLNIVYSQSSEIYIPFIEYHCKNCGKSGKRTVMSKSLPLDEFERKYF